jgi:hypothetical protein
MDYLLRAFLAVAPFVDEDVAELCVARAALILEVIGPPGGVWWS